MLSLKKLLYFVVFPALALFLVLSAPQEMTFAQANEPGEKELLSQLEKLEKDFPQSELSPESRKFELSLRFVLHLLEKGFYYELSPEQKSALFERIREAINKELRPIDRHTVIFSEKETREFEEDVEGEFGGIGATVSVHPEDNSAERDRLEDLQVMMEEKYQERNGKKLFDLLSADEKQEIEKILKAIGTIGARGILVGKPFPGSPAEKAGLREGWTIHAVDGVSVQGMLLEEDAINRIRGKPGTRVVLGVAQNSEESPRADSLVEIIVTRGIVEIPQITSTILDAQGTDGAVQKIGYLKIANFMGDSVAQFEEYLRALPPEKLIIDIRGNGGGSINDAYAILDRLMPEGLVMFSMKNREGETTQTADSNGDSPPLFSGKIVVLTDRYSASASEILAGVLHDHKLATLVGEKTFGKGSAQTYFPLFDKTAFKMTTELFFLPNGETPNGIGIEPDIYAEDDPRTPEDEVLRAALAFLAAQ